MKNLKSVYLDLFCSEYKNGLNNEGEDDKRVANVLRSLAGSRNLQHLYIDGDLSEQTVEEFKREKPSLGGKLGRLTINNLAIPIQWHLRLRSIY